MMTENRDRPLVSFLLYTYNQERFVREAVEGAFAQTYSPLEIILSDDGSSDGTFDIVRSLADAYQGPHRVVLNRNPRNLGIEGHFRKVTGMATGAFFVAAAGDDVSLPNRVASMMEAWEASGRPVCEIHSLWRELTPEGAVLPAICGGETVIPSQPEYLLRKWGLHPKGAVCGYSRKIFDVFGGVNPGCPCEDVPMAWRAAMLGKIIIIPQVLVHWRKGTGVWGGADYSSQQARLNTWVRFVSEMRLLALQAADDVAKNAGAGRALKKAAAGFQRETQALYDLKDAAFYPFLIGFLKYACKHWPSKAMLKTANRRLMIGSEEKGLLSVVFKGIWWVTR